MKVREKTLLHSFIIKHENYEGNPFSEFLHGILALKINHKNDSF
jgi:hypothetical protein